jgi:hypothetical protein
MKESRCTICEPLQPSQTSLFSLSHLDSTSINRSVKPSSECWHTGGASALRVVETSHQHTIIPVPKTIQSTLYRSSEDVEKKPDPGKRTRHLMGGDRRPRRRSLGNHGDCIVPALARKAAFPRCVFVSVSTFAISSGGRGDWATATISSRSSPCPRTSRNNGLSSPAAAPWMGCRMVWISRLYRIPLLKWDLGMPTTRDTFSLVSSCLLELSPGANLEFCRNCDRSHSVGASGAPGL